MVFTKTKKELCQNGFFGQTQYKKVPSVPLGYCLQEKSTTEIQESKLCGLAGEIVLFKEETKLDIKRKTFDIIGHVRCLEFNSLNILQVEENKV